eukprot:CAMPEP_0183517834 /NCGR_PEP_ID=MMETSP0371-20130417/15141_1 /TAXON_ID=268820 /ORGANISM="Peridinium aciculiferum, Strain PAER-2" /LENGTH=105 /DNA_ID=CAMNT_0025715801 /DNA_START=8 /DNA_END=325 /DNA_ORIENTATION=+
MMPLLSRLRRTIITVQTCSDDGGDGASAKEKTVLKPPAASVEQGTVVLADDHWRMVERGFASLPSKSTPVAPVRQVVVRPRVFREYLATWSVEVIAMGKDNLAVR